MPNQDPEIAEELLSHQTFLRQLAIDLVGTDADDLVQEIWQRALRRPPHRGGPLRAWLARVARNLAADRWRGEARRLEVEERRANELPLQPDVEARFELRKELVSALDTLSPSSRETILLRYFEGLAPRDIAKRQGAPLATVKARLRRGLAQLRERLDQVHGGDRGEWMSAVAVFSAPAGSGGGTGTLVIGGFAMGSMTKVLAAVLAVAVGLFVLTQLPKDEPTRTAGVERSPADVELAIATETTARLRDAETPVPAPTRRILVASEPYDGSTAVAKANVLRVILEGVTEDDALLATVALTGVDEREEWPSEIRDFWRCEGQTSEFDLGPFLARAAQREGLHVDELEIRVDHPHYLRARARVSLPGDDVQADQPGIREVRVPLVRPEFWPELTLAVRDAKTRTHLEGVELRISPGAGSAMWGRNAASTKLGDALASPIALMGGRDARESEITVAGLALRPEAGVPPRLVELERRFGPERGVIVSARAPGYAWASTALDVTKGERELLLEPSAALDVRLVDVSLEKYAALEAEPMLCIYWIREDGGNQYVRFELLDETIEAEGFRLENLVPGEYRVAVELGGGSWIDQPVLALEELSLAAGEARELVLTLKNPPASPERADLGGVVSFPAEAGRWNDENVRLQIYFQPTQSWREPDIEFSLGELRRVDGPLASWAFRAVDLPVGRYRVQLLPFLKVWMIDLPIGGIEDLELALPELAEVIVETVDSHTGQRVPREELYYRHLNSVPGQQQYDLVRANTEEPGLFRFWSAPGEVRVWPKFPNGSEREYGGNGKDLALVPGRQSLKFELAPPYVMRFEFREDGTALPTGPQGLDTSRHIRAVDHEGRVTGGGLQRNMRVTLSAPGTYEISFDGVDADRYHPLPPRLVHVRAGETTEVIVELQRR